MFFSLRQWPIFVSGKSSDQRVQAITKLFVLQSKIPYLPVFDDEKKPLMDFTRGKEPLRNEVSVTQKGKYYEADLLGA